MSLCLTFSFDLCKIEGCHGVTTNSIVFNDDMNQCGRTVSMFQRIVLPPFSLWVPFNIDLILFINYITFVTLGKC